MKLPLAVCLTVLIAAICGAATADAAAFRCSASAGRITVLGQTTEPLTANASGTACAGDNKSVTGPAAGFTGPLTIGALLASTEVFPAQKSVVSTGGVADLRVASAPSLPITLPPVAVPDAAKALIAGALHTSVDLSAVKSLIPAVPDAVQNAANAALNATNAAINAANAALNASNAALNASNLATNTANAATNAANLATNTANAALNATNAALNAANLATNNANAATNAANAAFNLLNAAAIAIDPSLALPTNLPTSLPVNLPVDAVTNLVTNLPVNLPVDAVTNLVTNLVTSLPTNLLLHPADLIPASVNVDVSGALDSALAALLPDGKLPARDLLRVQGAVAYAAGACKNGTPSVAGSSSVDGIKVFGQALATGTVTDQVLTLIDAASIDPANIPVPAIDLASLGLTQQELDLINSIPAAKDALDAAIALARGAVHSALDGLDPIHVLDPTVAQVKVVPGARVQDATSVVQQALNVSVKIAGQQVVDAVIGEAKASSAGVDCSDPVVDPSAADTPSSDGNGNGNVTGAGNGYSAPSTQPATPEQAALQCSDSRVVLVDVLEHGSRVKLNGVADPALAGKTVDIVFDATGDTVAHAKVSKDGSFDTTAPLPPARLRDTNDARYMAKLGKERSINLKLRRRMIVTSMTSNNGKVTIAGRVLPPLGKPLQSITLRRRVSCSKEQIVTHFKPRSDGRFRITVRAPKGLGTAVYRMTTKVRVNAESLGMFDTYTLPRAVALAR